MREQTFPPFRVAKMTKAEVSALKSRATAEARSKKHWASYRGGSTPVDVIRPPFARCWDCKGDHTVDEACPA